MLAGPLSTGQEPTMTKEFLLNLGCFIENEYLDFYLQLINANYENKAGKYFEKHHIIPRSYFKLNNLLIDNSKTNTVFLSHFNHCLAHYYLCLCLIGELKYKNQYAFIKMTHITTRWEDFDFDNFLLQADQYNKIYTDFINEQSIRESKAHANGIGVKGRHWFTNGIIKIMQKECPVGFWKCGSPTKGLKQSAEIRKHKSEAAKKRNTTEYRLKMSKIKHGAAGTVLGKIWINNGKIEKYINNQLELPIGFTKGRLKK